MEIRLGLTSLEETAAGVGLVLALCGALHAHKVNGPETIQVLFGFSCTGFHPFVLLGLEMG